MSSSQATRHKERHPVLERSNNVARRRLADIGRRARVGWPEETCQISASLRLRPPLHDLPLTAIGSRSYGALGAGPPWAQYRKIPMVVLRGELGARSLQCFRVSLSGLLRIFGGVAS